MAETRQQRRARERADIKAHIHQKVTSARTILEMWRVYRDAQKTLLDGIDEDGVFEGMLETAFYAGAAGMFELTMRVAPAAVSEDEGAAMLQRLEDELRAHTSRKAGVAAHG